MTGVFCNGKLFLREKNAPPLFLCVRFFSPFFSRPNVSMCLGFWKFSFGVHELSLDKQKKNSLSLVDFIIHISDLSFSSLSKPHFTRVLVLWPRRERVFFRKKRGTPKTPAKLCCFDSFFGEGARAFRKRKRERERETESFFATRERSRVHLGS